jgi:hypothetical protein
MEKLWIIYARKKMPSRYLDEVDRTDTLENVLKLIAKYQEKLGPEWEVYYAQLSLIA